MTPKYSPILWWPQKKYPQNPYTPKNIYFSENPKKYSKFWTQKIGPSLRMYGNIRAPPPPPPGDTVSFHRRGNQPVFFPVIYGFYQDSIKNIHPCKCVFYMLYNTVKPVLSNHSKRAQKWFSAPIIAECRSKVLQNAPRGAFCNTFDLH